MRLRSAEHDGEFLHLKSTWWGCGEARVGSHLTRQVDGLSLARPCGGRILWQIWSLTSHARTHVGSDEETR